MFYLTLAHMVLLVHAAIVAFVAMGGLVALWRPQMAYWHLPALAWGGTVLAMGWICPLTPLENWLRTMAGKGQYEGGFIEHYLTMLVYPPGLTRDTQILLAILLIVANVAIYAVWYRRRRRAKGQP